MGRDKHKRQTLEAGAHLSCPESSSLPSLSLVAGIPLAAYTEEYFRHDGGLVVKTDGTIKRQRS